MSWILVTAGWSRRGKGGEGGLIGIGLVFSSFLCRWMIVFGCFDIFLVSSIFFFFDFSSQFVVLVSPSLGTKKNNKKGAGSRKGRVRGSSVACWHERMNVIMISIFISRCG